MILHSFRFCASCSSASVLLKDTSAWKGQGIKLPTLQLVGILFYHLNHNHSDKGR